MIRRVLATLSVLVLAWLGLLGSLLGATAVPAQAGTAYTYGGQCLAERSTQTTTESDPRHRSYVCAVGRVAARVLGPAPRADGTRGRSTTTYDATAGLAQLARATVTTSGRAGLFYGGLSSMGVSRRSTVGRLPQTQGARLDRRQLTVLRGSLALPEPEAACSRRNRSCWSVARANS